MNFRKIMYVVIAIVCVWSIAVGVYEQVNKKNQKIEIAENVVPTEHKIKDEKTRKTQEELKKEFDKIFTNEILIGQYDTSSITKIDEDREIVYASSGKREGENYEIDINFPIINIDNEYAKEIDAESKQIFIEKAKSIMQKTTGQTIYTITYSAYVNQNILSIIIKSTLKEEEKPQRIMVQTYNINLDTGEKANIKDVLKVRNVDEETITKEINETIETAIQETNIIKETGYEVYSRNIKDAIYSFDNIDTFFLDRNGALCIVFAYGNYNFTSEMDIVEI